MLPKPRLIFPQPVEQRRERRKNNTASPAEGSCLTDGLNLKFKVHWQSGWTKGWIALPQD
jgi:hypothetical protein